MQRRLSPPARARGSSLVETLVATALGLLVLVLSTRSVLAFVVGESGSSAAKTVAGTLAFARAEAAQRRSPVGLCGLDPSDAAAPSGQVHCLPAGVAWPVGWIVYGDTNLNGELDDGEAVLRVYREARVEVGIEDGGGDVPAAITFRPIGTLAHATPQRLRVAMSGDAAAHAQVVCVAIDGYTSVLTPGSVCR